MRLRSPRLDVRASSADDIEVQWSLDGDRLTWSIANRADGPVAVDAVAVVARLDPVVEPLRMLRHGYQSWSPTGVATFRVDHDPSRVEGVRSLPIGMHHADWDRAEDGGVSCAASSSPPCATARARCSWPGSWAAGSTMAPSACARRGTARRPSSSGSRRSSAAPCSRPASGASCTRWPWPRPRATRPLLEEWAGALGDAGSARTSAPYQVGWCSWYHYFHAVTEVDLRSNLARAAEWPFDVFQLDDGFQAAIGDWLATNDTFPTAVEGLAAAIAAEGRTPGIWIAPFLAGADSQVARAHPGWLAVHEPTGSPLVGMANEAWGGPVNTLDTSHPEVLDHLEDVARDLVAAGFPYLKLDFTFAPSMRGRYADPGRTPAQRVRAGFEAIRRGAGDDPFLLGCGAPMGVAVGLVDGMRIGADVAPWWHPQDDQYRPPGHTGGEPATVNAWRNTLSRSFLHRRLWLNDPDCLMLRTEQTRLEPEQMRAWALAVGVSGGMALVSDDLALLGPDARALLDEVVALGREADDDPHPPRCTDLLDHDPPTRLVTAAMELVGDPAAGRAHVQGLLA